MKTHEALIKKLKEKEIVITWGNEELSFGKLTEASCKTLIEIISNDYKARFQAAIDECENKIREEDEMFTESGEAEIPYYLKTLRWQSYALKACYKTTFEL